ncbi:MAG: PDZ domain-containing protein [Planctomyces sp.]|nr:PDZ domain-containing protein [Planctomyces sp.]
MPSVLTRFAILLLLVVLQQGQGRQRNSQFLTNDRLTSGPRVRAAFRDAAAPSRAWTVRIQRDRAPVALGVIVDPDGYVLTKLSEIQKPPPRPQRPQAEGETEPPPIVVQVAGGKEYLFRIAATHPETDLALLHINATGLETVPWATDAKYDLGRWIVTCGPRGVASNVGVISSKRREIRAERIPGILGVQLDVGGGPARIVSIFDNGAAANAGLQEGDVVEKLGDTTIRDSQQLIRLIRRQEPGDVVQLSVRRGEDVRDYEVTLSHPFGIYLSQYAQQIRMGGELSDRRDGFKDVFSHDTVMDPQQCGGPVVDVSGRVIGVNIARSARIETLALPAEVVVRAIEEMRNSLKTSPSTPPPEMAE